jgi:hypothetical protein
MEAVAEQWETNLGIDVTFSSIVWATYRDVLESCSDVHGSGE